jgi:DNA-binding NtrC family response regulator
MKTSGSAKRTLLIIDDDRLLCDAVKGHFSSDKIDVISAYTGADGLGVCARCKVDVVLLDQKLPDGKGVDLCKSILAHNDDTKIIFITAYPSFDNAVSAIKLGAFDYLSKPFELEELELAIDQSLRTLDLERVEQIQTYKNSKESGETLLFRKSSGLAEVWRMVELAASTDSPVLITGETGVGKNVVAKAIHYEGTSRNTSFVDINCASFPESLIEAELFGFEKGAFTGAVSTKRGIFEMAEGGTLFLDEIGNIPIHLQSKLLGVLDDKKIKRLGGESVRHVDFRVIAATNTDIEQAMTTGDFREDLFFRLSVIRIHVPPLREHIEDVPGLCRFFIQMMGGTSEITIPDSDVAGLMAYHWPGNIRELKNILERSMLLRKGTVIRPSELFGANKEGKSHQPPEITEGPDVLTLAEVQEKHIRQTLVRLSGNHTRAAKALGISRSTLKRKIQSYRID